MLTHRNLLADVKAANKALTTVYDEAGSTLLFLPLAHVFGRVIEIGSVLQRSKLGHTADVRRLPADLPAFRPTFLLAVPRVFEKLFEQTLNPFKNPSERRWIPVTVDLSAYAGEEMQIILNTVASGPGGPPDDRGDMPLWGAPEVVKR